MPVFVNEAQISDEDVHAEMQYHPAASLEESRYKATQALVVRQLLLQEAQKLHLLEAAAPCTPEQAAKAVDLLIQREIAVPQADEASCLRYYEQNPQRFVDRSTGKPLPFTSVNAHIREYLHARSLQTGISQFIKILAGRAKITGFELAGTDSPLVQ